MDPASLQNLQDIVTPPPAPWLPPAPGWYALSVTFILLLAWIVGKSFKRWQNNRYRREALYELAQLEKKLTGPEPCRQSLAQLPQLLKRTAIAAYGRAPVASLSGDLWLAFLDKTGTCDIFSQGSGRLINDCSSQPLIRLAKISQEQVEELHQAVYYWIKKHSRTKEE